MRSLYYYVHSFFHYSTNSMIALIVQLIYLLRTGHIQLFVLLLDIPIFVRKELQSLSSLKKICDSHPEKIFICSRVKLFWIFGKFHEKSLKSFLNSVTTFVQNKLKCQFLPVKFLEFSKHLIQRMHLAAASATVKLSNKKSCCSPIR